MKNNYALITAGSSGIGGAIAEELAKRGHNLIIVALDDENLKKTKQNLEEKYKVICHTFGADLTDVNTPESIEKWVKDNDFQLDILINNAGIGSKNSFDKINIDFYKKQLTINVINTVLLTRLLVDNLKKSSPSYILNVGSLGGFFHIPEKASYVASKAFVYNFSKSINYELESSGIHVSVLCPSGVATNENTTKAVSELKGLSKKTILKPEEIAKIAIDGMFHRKTVIIPGALNRYLLFFNNLIPEVLKKKIIKNQLVKNSRYE